MANTGRVLLLRKKEEGLQISGANILAYQISRFRIFVAASVGSSETRNQGVALKPKPSQLFRIQHVAPSIGETTTSTVHSLLFFFIFFATSEKCMLPPLVSGFAFVERVYKQRHCDFFCCWRTLQFCCCVFVFFPPTPAQLFSHICFRR